MVAVADEKDGSVPVPGRVSLEDVGAGRQTDPHLKAFCRELEDEMKPTGQTLTVLCGLVLCGDAAGCLGRKGVWRVGLRGGSPGTVSASKL